MGNRPHRRRMQLSARRGAALATMTVSILAMGRMASAQPSLAPGIGEVGGSWAEVPMRVRFTRQSGAREHDWHRIQHPIRRR